MAATTVGTTVLSVAAVRLLFVIAPAPSEAANNSMGKPGCQATCGGVNIPYPFGVGDNCSRGGFEIAGKNGTTPVLATKNYQILNLSVETSMALVQLPIAYQCYNASGSTNWTYREVIFNPQGVYRISNARNELVVLGCNTLAYINSRPTTDKDSPYYYGIYTGCVSYATSIERIKDGQCTGIGCCKVDIPPGLTDNYITFEGYDHAHFYKFCPCSYSFLVDRDHYNFSKADLKMDKKRMMPVWLDWAISPPINGTDTLTCVEAQKDPASYECKSRNSNCTNAINGPGYSCQCADGYEGNPYLEGDGGCTSKHAVEIRDNFHTVRHPVDLGPIDSSKSNLERAYVTKQF